jgi:nucleoside-diphosphate-sugar epimerase
MPDRTVVVLGGSGFIGRWICRAFLAAGWQVFCVSRRRAELPGVGFLEVDLCAADADELRALFAELRPAAVVNATGAVWGGAPELLEVSNVDVVRRLVAAVAGLRPRPRLIQLGTVHEYGPMPSGCRITEQTPVQPVGAYAVTKARGSEVLLAASQEGMDDGEVLRIGNAFGPGTSRGSLLGRVAAGLAAGESVFELSPLIAWRDFIDVRDIAAAVVSAARADVRGQVVNLGRGVAVGVRDLVHLLVATSGVPARVVEREAEVASPGSGAEWQEIDISRAREVLGWKPRYEPAESVSALWQTCLDGAPAEPCRAGER